MMDVHHFVPDDGESPIEPEREREWCEPPFPGTLAGFVEKVACAPFTAAGSLEGLADRTSARFADSAEEAARGAVTGATVGGLVGLGVALFVADLVFAGGNFTRAATTSVSRLMTGTGA